MKLILKYLNAGLITDQLYQFVSTLYPAFYKSAIKAKISNPKLFAQLATTHCAFEDGYGLRKDNRYAGWGASLSTKKSFKDVDEFADAYISQLQRWYPDSLNAVDTKSYVNGLYNGYELDDNNNKKLDWRNNLITHAWNSELTEDAYHKKVNGCLDRVNTTINLFYLRNPGFEDLFKVDNFMTKIKNQFGIKKFGGKLIPKQL